MKASLVLVVTCALVIGAAASADPLFVEGHVVNLRTALPLRTAVVSLTDALSVPAGSPPEVVGKSLTDDSGFFSIQLQEEDLTRGPLDIAATCKTPRGERRTDLLTARVVLRPGTIRRDLYVDAFRRRSQRTCQLEIGPE